MAEVDYDWVNQQLDNTEWSDEVCQAVVDVLGLLEESKFSELEQYSIVDALGALLRGHAIIADTPEQVWVQVQIGFVHAGDIVRVKHDAFDGEIGKIHNGRVGKVQAARSGDVIFRSTDQLDPYLDGAHYPPQKLERRVK